MTKLTAPYEDGAATEGNVAARCWHGWLEGAIFFFLCLLAILLPHSIKGSQHAWQIAFLLWLLALVIRRQRPFPQPLSAPLLAYVVLSGVSTMLSANPYLSWERMKIVCLLLVAIVVAQNVHRLTQVRTLVYLLIASGVAAAAFTAWQYTYGIGVRVSYTAPGTAISQSHLFPGDIITRINDQPVHTPAELDHILQDAPAKELLRVDYVRGFPLHKKRTYITREQVVKSGWGTPALVFTRGRPLKAQGKIVHYVNFAEVLMQIGCLAWAMLLVSRTKTMRVVFGVSFAALVGALLLTETRAAMAGLAVGGFICVLVLAGRRSRIWATVGLMVVVVAALLWIRHTRGPLWLGTHDAGTSFRTMMWQDGMRLIGEHPLFGVGMETISTHWMQWHIRAYSVFHDESHFHNDYIQLAVERGLPAMAAWAWFVIAYIMLLLRLILRCRKQSRFAAGVASGLLASFVAYQITAVVHYNLGIEIVAMMLYFFLGLAIAVDRISRMAGALDVP